MAPNPYLPPSLTPEKYTLVVDLLQVMHSPKKQSFRPYSQYFLDEMSQYYEIVAFSVAFPNQLNKLIDILDKKRLIQYRLFRHHAIKSYGRYYKDMSRLGRDLSKTILLDVQLDKLSKDNEIQVRPWLGSSKDTVLAQLCPMLAMIVIKGLDASEAASKFQEQMAKNVKSGVKYINYDMNLA